MTTTELPAFDNRYAVVKPAIPAPIMQTSAETGSVKEFVARPSSLVCQYETFEPSSLCHI
jgi:hypothetical protein